MRGRGVGVCELFSLRENWDALPGWIKNYHCKHIPLKLRRKIKRALVVYFLEPRNKQELEVLTKYVFGWMPLWRTRCQVLDSCSSGSAPSPSDPLRKEAEIELENYLQEPVHQN